MTLPFENGERELVAFPQKRPLILLTSRPPQLETPFGVFNEGVLTPNDAFFVRYHWSGIPTSIDAATYRLRVGASVNTALELSLDALKQLADPAFREPSRVPTFDAFKAHLVERYYASSTVGLIAAVQK